MLATGFSLAVLTSTGFYLIYRKLPKRLRRFMSKHVLVTDTIACFLTYMLFGGTLVALFAAAWVGILISLMLAMVSNPTTRDLLEKLALMFDKVRESTLTFLDKKFSEEKKSEETKEV